MTIQNWLEHATQKLTQAGISTPRLDAELLLAHALQVTRTHLHTHPNHQIQKPATPQNPHFQGRASETLEILNNMVERRVRHEPIAYIIGSQEFYGRDFIVSPDTLTPRPETETMLDLLMPILNGELRAANNVSSVQFDAQHPAFSSPLTIIDVGTGSGCIIISAALEIAKNSKLKAQNFEFIGLDISKPALKIAKQNAKNLGAKVDFQHFDLKRDSISSFIIPRSLYVIFANLPYVPTDFKINLSASHEPDFAIFGGADGLDYYRTLFKQLSSKQSIDSSNSKQLPQNCLVLTESLPPQHEELNKIAEKNGFQLTKTQDLIQVFTPKP